LKKDRKKRDVGVYVGVHRLRVRRSACDEPLGLEPLGLEPLGLELGAERLGAERLGAERPLGRTIDLARRTVQVFGQI